METKQKENICADCHAIIFGNLNKFRNKYGEMICNLCGTHKQYWTPINIEVDK